MITTYAVSLLTRDCTEHDRVTLIDLVTDWQVEQFPFDSDEDSRPGLSMRTRLATDDPVFRVTITDAPPGATHVLTTTVTTALLDGVLTFDVRIVSSARTVKVAPHKPPLVPSHIVTLIRNVLLAVPTFDAERQIMDRVDVIDNELKGQEIGYFVEAESRNLPVVVEIRAFNTSQPSMLAQGLGPLVGLVHMAHITTPDALAAYAQVVGLPLVGPGSVIVHWAGKTEPTIVRTSELSSASLRNEAILLVTKIMEASARSVAAHRVPPPPRDDDNDLMETSTKDTAVNSRGNEDSVAHIENLEAMINDLEGALATADRTISEQRDMLEKRVELVDKLVLRNLSLETFAGTSPEIAAVSTMAEALEFARTKFEFLVLHERAIESGMQLQGPDPMAILHDLSRLNGVARRWSAGEISGTSIKIACTEAGLNYAPAISETARRKYEEDYLIEWRGKLVRAEPHIKRGKKAHLVRTHIYFDQETQQVVVAYIGRHLRDKGSST